MLNLLQLLPPDTGLTKHLSAPTLEYVLQQQPTAHLLEWQNHVANYRNMAHYMYM